MKTIDKKPFLNMDERNKGVALRIIAFMYFLTIASMHGIVIYRQFALGQDIYDFEDFAIVLTVNSLFLVCALLYYSAIPIQKIRLKVVLLLYAAIVILGSFFTYLKYNVFQSPGLSIHELFDKLVIVFSISGLILLFFVLFSILGRQKMNKALEEDPE